ncbi:hypothetical protein [Actinomadura sp. 6K520]|uniref:hypothetical protein n=1 Tax=Actinomadura sp. 6K520 TaxID=2530364 RepID=UPI0010521872|nr:hypothetical protein [Actinomadura sp. 6K520]TDE32352.1 hypothetical protein E1289_15725 [Actinomadura sp. 6K520]
MTQLFLAIVIMLAGVALGVTELIGGRRRRAESTQKFAELQDQIRRMAEAAQASLNNEIGTVRGEVAATRTEMRDQHAADLRSAMGVLHDAAERSRVETARQITEVTDKLEALRGNLETEAAESHRETLARLERVTEELRGLALRVGQHHEEVRSGLAAEKSRLDKIGNAQRSHDHRLNDLEKDSWGAVRGEIKCDDTDVSYAVEDVMLHLASAAGLRLVSSRVVSSTPLKARYWFSGIDETELEDWLRNAVQTEDPRVKALFEIVKTMAKGAVSLGPIVLHGGSGRGLYGIGNQYTDIPA